MANVLDLIINLKQKGAHRLQRGINKAKQSIGRLNNVYGGLNKAQGAVQRTSKQVRDKVGNLSSSFSSLNETQGAVQRTADQVGVSQQRLKNVGKKYGVTLKGSATALSDYNTKLGGLANRTPTVSGAIDVLNTRMMQGEKGAGLFTSQLSKQQQFLSNVGDAALAYGQKQKSASAGAKVAKKRQMGLMGVMGLSMNQFNAVQASSEKYGSSLAAVGAKFRSVTHGAKGFRMEMLSLMFGGMQLKKTMFGLLKPAAKTAGIFKIAGIAIKMLFLPFMLAILPAVMKVANAIMGLPKNIKILLGVIVLSLGIIGALIMLVGQLTLAFGGLSIALGPILVIILAVVAVIVAAVAIFLYWGEIVDWFTGIWESIPGPIKAVLKVIYDQTIGRLTGMINAIIGFGELIYNIFTGQWGKAKESVMKILRGLTRMILGIPPKWINSLLSSAGDFYNAAVKIASNLLDGLVNTIKGIGSAVADALWSIIPQPFRGILKGATNIAGSLAMKTISGMIPGLQGGGRISQSGLAVVHKGETVVPPGQGGGKNIDITINMNNKVDSDVDITRMADRLEAELARRLRGKTL